MNAYNDGFPLPNERDNAASFAGMLKQALSERGVSYADLGADAGAATSLVTLWTQGGSVPDAAQCGKIAEHLRLTPLDAEALCRRAACARYVRPEAQRAIAAEVAAIRERLDKVPADAAEAQARREQRMRDQLATRVGRMMAALETEVRGLADVLSEEPIEEFEARISEGRTSGTTPPLESRYDVQAGTDVQAMVTEALTTMIEVARGEDDRGRAFLTAVLRFGEMDDPPVRRSLLNAFTASITAAWSMAKSPWPAAYKRWSRP